MAFKEKPTVVAGGEQVAPDALRALGVRVATGRFGAKMIVALENDGPVTIVLER